MLKVHILYEYGGDLNPFSCSQIRLLRPLTHPLNDKINVSWGRSYEPADVVIVDRCWKPGISVEVAQELVEKVKANQGCLIYSIDDNLLDLKVEGIIRSGLSQEQLMVVRYFLREADGVIVSTEQLKQRFLRLNPNIFVISNTLDERLLEGVNIPSQALSKSRKVIGYMGTYTHDADIMMVLQALRETLRKYQDNLELQLLGGISDIAVLQGFEGLPVRVLCIEDKTVEYPEFIPWIVKNLEWDLAIAPLEDTVFTRCKSDIKFLDYSALGIAGVYSRVPAYENTVRHLKTGYLSENNTESWREALELLLFDDALRHKLATQAQEYVFSTRILQQCAVQWQNAILSVVERPKTKM